MDTNDFESTASTSQKNATDEEKYMVNLLASLSKTRAHKGDKMAALARKRKEKVRLLATRRKQEERLRKMAKTLEITNTSLQLVRKDITILEKKLENVSDGENNAQMHLQFNHRPSQIWRLS